MTPKLVKDPESDFQPITVICPGCGCHWLIDQIDDLKYNYIPGLGEGSGSEYLTFGCPRCKKDKTVPHDTKGLTKKLVALIKSRGEWR